MFLKTVETHIDGCVVEITQLSIKQHDEIMKLYQKADKGEIDSSDWLAAALAYSVKVNRNKLTREQVLDTMDMATAGKLAKMVMNLTSRGTIEDEAEAEEKKS